MKQYVQLMNGMLSKKRLILAGIALLLFLLAFGVYTRSILRILMFIIGLSVFIGGVFSGRYFFKYGKPDWLRHFEFVLRNHWQHIKTFNWQKHLGRKASKANIPYYLIIGSPASSNTALLHELGRSAKKVTCQTAKETCSYDQWYLNERVLFDIPGSMLYNDENWLWFISELKKTKIKSRLKGMTLVISAESLSQEVNLQETILRQLNRFYEALHIKLPINLVITHCDSIEGFYSFIDSVNIESRKKVFGVIFAQHQCISSQLNQWIEQIYEGLYAALVKQLSLQRPNKTKAELLQFPQHFRQLSEALLEFVERLCQDSIYQEKIYLGGVYLTGQNSDAQSESYFVQELMSKQLFNQNLQVEPSYKRKKIKKWTHRSQLALVILMILSGFGSLISTYLTHATLLNNGKKLAESGLKALENPIDSFDLSELQPIAAHVFNLRHFKENQSSYQTLGISQVQSQLEVYDKILAKGLNLVYQGVKHKVMKDLQAYHEQWIRGNKEANSIIRGSYYTQFKLYLMLNYPQHIELDFASEAFASNWQAIRGNHSKQTHSKAILRSLSQTYLEYLKQLNLKERKQFATPNRALISIARQDLKTDSSVMNVFAEIEKQFKKTLGSLNAEALFGEEGVTLWQVNYRLPKFYSLNSYKKVIRPAFIKHARYDAKHDWVIHAPLHQLIQNEPQTIQSIHDKNGAQKMLNELNTLYFQNYEKEWSKFVSALKYTPIQFYEEAAQQLTLLEQEAGPFLKLFQTIHANFALKAFLPKEEQIPLPNYVKQKMNTWFEMTQTNLNSNSMLGPYLKQLSALQQETERLAIGQGLGQAAEQYVVHLLTGNGQETELYKTSMLVEKMMNRVSDVSVRKAMRNVLLSPVRTCYQALINETMRELQSEWKSKVLTTFKEQLASNFPFNHAGQDANLGLFINFFQPQDGVLSTFKQRLQPLVRREGGRYISRDWLGVSIPFSTAFLNHLAALDRLTQALFPNGKNDLTWRFSVYPIPISGVKEILLVSNGQSYPYRNGPQEWVSFNWPSSDMVDHESFIRITQSNNEVLMTREFIGPWGLFHLMHTAVRHSKQERGYRFQWILNHEGHSKMVQLVLANKNEIDPFELLLFNPLKLEESIT
ncbi:type VI secretion protein IcmF/TssM N-terminal domain-containing protein [Legionella impletisoli]|uniref:Secretion protein n=1 Tax=Legionella impletisoli TaxID=343510 RepID=A0A917JY18_9GAMM|nr:type VI secretion protein IcmF/TssM N-terminal domain-containing protein [Legionella impletisoli]GGI91823.1 secretion protein [Legionella impletisoli]